jgi:hypothetical protein
MKDLYHTFSKGKFFRLLALVIVALTANYAKAATIVDLGELVPDQEYTLEDYKGYTATYTATASGTIYCDSPSGAHFVPYTDADHENEVTLSSGNQVGNLWPYSFKATAGTTYYFYIDYVWSGGTFKLYTGKSLEISDINYPNNSTISAAGDTQITISFNTGIALSSVSMSTNGTTVGITNPHVNNAILSLSIGEQLKKWYANGTIVPEQKFTIDITGLCASGDATNLYNGDGNLSLTYYAASAPIELTSATNADGSVKLVNASVASVDFLSYFSSSNANGKYIFNFSEPINPSSGEVKLQYGDSEGADGEFYEETLTPTFSNDNKTLTVDLSGKVRRPKDMVSSGTTYSQMVLALTHLQGADGQYVYTDTQGGLGSFYFTFPYKEVTSTISTEWAELASLANASSIEVYVTNYSSLEYDGIKFAGYTDGELSETIVEKSALTIATDDYDGATITIPVPDSAKTQTDVTVSFYNAVVADGLDHTDVLSQVYNETLRILASTPAQGAEIETIERLSTVSVTLSRTDLGYVQYEIWDLNPDDPDDACVSSRATLTASADDPAVYTATRYGASLKCIKGHVYRFDVLGWAQESDARGTGYSNPAARASFTFSGATEVFTFSPAKFVSITPADGSTLESAEDREFTLVFDDLVKLESSTTFINLGQGATKAFESITPINGNGEYSKTWKLTIDSDYMSTLTGSVTLSVVAKDINDKLVEGNQGVEENSYFKFEYVAYFNNPDITFTPESGSTVTSISSIVAGSAIGIGRSWDNTVGNITLYKGQEFIANITNIEDGTEEQQADGSTLVTSQILTLPSAVTEAGNYQIFVPAGFFILGEEMTALKNKAYTLVYTIEAVKQVTEFKVVADPEDGSTISEPVTSLTLTFPNHIGASLSAGKATLLAPNATEAVSLGDAYWGNDDNQMVQPLGALVADEGKYVVSFPAGYFILDDDQGNSDDSPEFTVTFTYAKKVNLPCEVSPAYNAQLESFSGTMTFTFADAKRCSNKANITVYAPGDETGVEFEKTSATQSGVITFNIGSALTTTGTYRVHAPKDLAYYQTSDKTIVDSEEFDTYFTITGRAVEFTSTPEDGAEVEGEVEQITLNITNGIDGQAWLNDGTTKPVATLTKPDGTTVDLPTHTWNGDYGVIQSLDGYATDPGTYTVNYPAAYFWYTSTVQTLKEGGVPSAAFSQTFTIKGDDSSSLTYTVDPDPAEGSLTELSTLSITFSESISSFNFSNISKIGVSYNSDITYFDIENDSYSYSGNKLTLTFAKPFTESGRYIVNIPASTIFFGDWGDIENDEIYIAFVVEKQSAEVEFAVVTDPEDGSTVDAATKITLTFTNYAAADLCQGKATISKDGGDAENLSDAEWGIYDNQLVQNLDGKASEAGTYVVSFPEGYFMLFPNEDDFDNYVNSPAFTVTFTVRKASGIDAINADANANTRYFNLQGIEVKNPAAGTYIIVRDNKATKEIIK